ncbi:SIMPL domain-containing protein [Marinobacteraceae bacterium S3BR75-40.1]
MSCHKGLIAGLMLAALGLPLGAQAGTYQITLSDEQYIEAFTPDLNLTVDAQVPSSAESEHKNAGERAVKMRDAFLEKAKDVLSQHQGLVKSVRTSNSGVGPYREPKGETGRRATTTLTVQLEQVTQLQELIDQLMALESPKGVHLSYQITGGLAPSKADWSMSQREAVTKAYRSLEAQLIRQALNQCKAAAEELALDCENPARVTINHGISSRQPVAYQAMRTASSAADAGSSQAPYEKPKVSVNGTFEFPLGD